MKTTLTLIALTFSIFTFQATADAQLRVVPGANGPMMVPAQTATVTVAPQYPQSNFGHQPAYPSMNSVYVPQYPMPGYPTGPAFVTPNQLGNYNPQFGGFDSFNTQVDHSAFDPYRDASRNNGTLRRFRRPVRDISGNIIGYQQGEEWINSVTRNRHSNVDNFTPNSSGGVHRQRQVTSGLTEVKK